MTKDNILFGIVGLLAGLIIGFFVTNSLNKQQGFGAVSASSATAAQPGNLPPGHPDVPPGSTPPSGQQAGPSSAEVQAAIDKAKNEPDNFDAQVKAAEFYYQIQRFDGAIEFLTKANKLKPDDYDTIVHLGNAYFDAADADPAKFSDAEKWYAVALAKKPDDADVRTDYGLTFMLREPANYDRAIQEFKRSLEYDPSHTQTLQNLTVAYTRKGDATNASATLAKLEAADKSNPAIAKLRTDIDAMKTK
jgi:tetratricopeptide (TPR) repeat protein